MKMVHRFLLAAFFCASFSFAHTSIQERISQIPAEDSVVLEKFFRVLMEREGFGYTLLGSKPVSVTHWNEGYSFYHSLGCGALECTYLRNGLRVWKKYQHLFPSKKFRLFDHSFSLEGVSLRELILINLEELEAIKNRYPEILKRFSLSMLTNTGKPENLDFHLKMGLIFGYGYENSRLFLKQCEIHAKLGSLPLIPSRLPNELLEMDPIFIGCLKMDQAPQDLALDPVSSEYLSHTSIPFNSFTSYKKEQVLSCAQLPSFRADYRSSETKLLYDDYSTCRKKICNLLKSGNFLERTLTLLSE